MAGQIIFYVLAIVIIVFSILSVTSRRILRAATYLLFVLIATAGLYLLLHYQFLAAVHIILHNVYKIAEIVPVNTDMKKVGLALMGTDKYQYLLPFEAISVLLLACIIGGILIARKR